MIRRLALVAALLALASPSDAASAASSWITLRAAVTTLAAEGASVPASGSFVVLRESSSMPTINARDIEIRLPALTLNGGPTAVTFDVWRRDQATIDRIAQVTVQSGDAWAPQNVQINDVNAGQYYVTVNAFTGGAGPTLTTAAAISIRAVRL